MSRIEVQNVGFSMLSAFHPSCVMRRISDEMLENFLLMMEIIVIILGVVRL